MPPETPTSRELTRLLRRTRGNALGRYTVAVALPALALRLTVLGEPLLGRTVFVLFFGAVAGSAWFGGLGPGLVTTILSVLAADYYILPPLRQLALADPADVIPMGMFTLIAVMISSLTESLRSARVRAIEQAAQLAEQAEELGHNAELLQEQAAELENQVEEAQVLSEELELANEELRHSTGDANEARSAAERAKGEVGRILASITDPFVAYDRDWRFVYINEQAGRIFRASGRAEDLIGKTLWEAFPAIVGSPLEDDMRRAASGTGPGSFEIYSPELGVWYDVAVYSAPDGISATFKDVTARRRAAQGAHYLARANEVLASSLDYETTLATVARLCVPELADWCAVEILDEGGVSRQLAVAHVDPAKVRFAEELNRRYPPDPDSPTGAAYVLRTGRSEFYPEIPDELLVAVSRDEEHLRLARELGLKSAMTVPLAARGRTLGALTLVHAESGRRFTAEDLALAEELGRRAGVATDNARLYREAERARAEAEGANRAKSEFLTTMSHELRTPLNAIGGYAQLIELGLRGPVTDEQREDLRRIERSQRHLLAMINDVLNFAKIEAGRLQYEIGTVHVRPMLRSVSELIEPQSSARRIRLVSADVDESTTVCADADKLQQILLNLLSNAVKFTEPGGTVTLECAEQDSIVALTVRDTGRGIPADRLEEIFEPFVQVDKGPTRPVEGTGLGLAISRNLARGMGGDLTVESTPGRGSAFTLRLPMA